jgi:hypothetical protein
MSDTETEAEALGRLEAALDRIAQHAQGAPAPGLTEAAARLDRLIGQIRDALTDETEA